MSSLGKYFQVRQLGQTLGGSTVGLTGSGTIVYGLCMVLKCGCSALALSRFKQTVNPFVVMPDLLPGSRQGSGTFIINSFEEFEYEIPGRRRV
jgi:hypothetical protein